ncbi:MAG TPA: hemerythrin domain-containing protein [Caldimonas sp.]|nr:hemerythrin domain-containing protein [Caldimonas sp.]
MATGKKAAAKKAAGKKTAAKKSSGGRSAAKKAPARKAPSRGRADALALLEKQHRDVKALFRRYEKMAKQEADEGERQALATQICEMLTMHTTIEEEIFYPAARAAQVEEDLLDEAEVEHASAKDLIAQIQAGSPSDELYDAKVNVLGEYVNHHVEEEEGQMFPKCRRAKMDLEGLGKQMKQRSDAIMSGGVQGGMEQAA